MTLSKNKITVLNAEQIPNSVENFDVSHNSLSRFGKAALAEKSQLRRLNLSHNQLSIITTDSMRVVEGVHPVKVAVDNNPLECSCQMTWMLTPGSDAENKVSLI